MRKGIGAAAVVFMAWRLCAVPPVRYTFVPVRYTFVPVPGMTRAELVVVMHQNPSAVLVLAPGCNGDSGAMACCTRATGLWEWKPGE
jgi:hypothetical protein